MKKIAIIVPSYKPVPDVKGGGVEHLVTNIIDSNEHVKNCFIDLYTIYDEETNKIKYKNTKLIRIKKSKFKYIVEKIINKFFSILKIEMVIDFYDFSVKKKISNQIYDYIIVENNMYLYKTIYDSTNNSKYIFHLHNDIGGRDKPKHLCEFIAKSAYRIITCSNFLKKRFYDITGNKEACVLNNTVDFSKFYYDEQIHYELRKQYDISSNDIILLYIGRISYEKGILQLLSAFKKNKKNNYKLFIIGDQDNADSYTKRNFQYMINKMSNVKYLGKIDNDKLYKYISMSDCIVVPTIIEEAFGLVAIESFACSKPVIVSNSGGLTDIADESCGFIFDKDNFEESFLNVLSKIDDNAYLNKLGINGFKKIKNNEDYDSNKYYDNLINILEK